MSYTANVNGVSLLRLSAFPGRADGSMQFKRSHLLKLIDLAPDAVATMTSRRGEDALRLSRSDHRNFLI